MQIILHWEDYLQAWWRLGADNLVESDTTTAHSCKRLLSWETTLTQKTIKCKRLLFWDTTITQKTIKSAIGCSEVQVYMYAILRFAEDMQTQWHHWKSTSGQSEILTLAHNWRIPLSLSQPKNVWEISTVPEVNSRHHGRADKHRVMPMYQLYHVCQCYLGVHCTKEQV